MTLLALYLDFRSLGWDHQAAIELAEIHIRLEAAK